MEVLLTVGMIVLTIFFLTNFFTIITDIANALALASANGVAQDISGLITLSAAAPNEIFIQFSPTDKFSYELQIKDRLVNVKLISLEEEECTDIFRIRVDPAICQSSVSTAVDDLEVFATGNKFEVSKDKQGYGVNVE